MGDGGDISDADSDETIVTGSVLESDLEEEELRGNRLFFIDKNMAPGTENNITDGIRNINGEELSPEIQFIFKHSENLQIPKETELTNLVHQGSNENEDSQSLLQSGINFPVIAADISQVDCPKVASLRGEYQLLLDSQVNGFLEISDGNLPEIINNEDSPERSLLSGMDIAEDSMTKCTEVSDVFLSAKMTSKGKDMTDKSSSPETLVFDITAENLENDLMEPISDLDNLQMLDVLEYQDDALSVYSSRNEEDTALPEELLTALNSLSESVAASAISPPLEKDTIVEKHLAPYQRDDDCTQITGTSLKAQFNSQCIEETGASIVTKMVCPSEEQTDCDKYMYKLVCSGHQNTICHDRPAEKENSPSKDISSCEQPTQVTSCAFGKPAQRGKDFTGNHVDPKSSCQMFPEGMDQKICSNETIPTPTKNLDSNTKDKIQECSQLRNGLCHGSSSDIDFKVKQVRKSQRIAKKKKKIASKKYLNDSSCNCISPSSINRRDILGQSLLHRAAMEDDLDSVCAMIKAGADVNVQDHAGWTPLHKTSVAGYFEATNELLKAGADVNCKGNKQVTPLHDAVKEGHYKVAELLLWYGADPLFKNDRGKNALDEATDKHVRKLLERYIAKSSTSSVSGSSHSNKMKKKACSKLLNTTLARISKRNAKGETRLHLAAKKRDLSLVKSLIASGACVNLKDNAGWTAIHEASNRGFTEIIAELLKAGADVNSKSLDGVLPIHDAVSGNHFEAVQLLLLHGANPNERDICGGTALDEATCEQMKELLKSYGATETKEIPSMNDDVEERELRPSRSKKIRSCCDCHKNDSLVLQPTSASQKCDTNESISKVLQEVEESQERLLLFELRNQKDADLYIQDLSQIQNTLNAILAKQKSERDELAKKYRASVESFKQGALREQLVQLVSRQKRLLLMAQNQKELGQKIQNYKTSRKEFSSSTKQISKNVLCYCERCNRNHDTYHLVPCPNVVKTSWEMEHSFFDQDSSQYPNKSLNIPVENGEAVGQKEVEPKKLVSESMLKEHNIPELVNSKSSSAVDQAILSSESGTSCIQESHPIEIGSISVAPQRNKLLSGTSRICTLHCSETGKSRVNNSHQPATENQHTCTNESLQQHSNISKTFQMQPESTQKNTLPKNRISFSANLESPGLFSKGKIIQTASDSAKQLNFRTNRRKKNQLVDLIEQGKLKPGNDVLEFILQDVKHKASLLANGKVKTDNNLIYQTPVQWIKALLGNDITVSWRYICNKVRYCGTLLSEIIAEVHVPQGPELLLQQKKLPVGGNPVEWDHNQGGSFSHNTSSFQDTGNIQQEVESFSQEEGEIPLSPEVEAEGVPSSICEIKLPSQSTFLKTPGRFLQFNKIVLIQDEEFLPCHTMEQYWDFYVHSENFGF